MDKSLRAIASVTLIVFTLWVAYNVHISWVLLVLPGMIGAYILGTLRLNILTRIKSILGKLQKKKTTETETPKV